VTNYHVLAMLARERQHTLLAQAQAARQAKLARSRPPRRPRGVSASSARRAGVTPHPSGKP
jgi:hypothetical protein